MYSVQVERGRDLVSPSFFDRKTLKVARDLLGREIIRQVGPSWLRARIVETEAYLEKDDPAAHCSRGPTPRAKVMFGPPGVIYVYFIYGNYFMLNFVTEKEGKAGAVLIRAVEPVEGIETMVQLRGIRSEVLRGRSLLQLTNGPAKLVLALGIDGSLNGKPLALPHLAVARGKPVADKDVVVTTRIGINVAKELPYRFYEKGNPFVSKL
ncbi:MAG: DNA-3-methyladenine glycosylase [Bdellovibrionota bacterium]